MHTCYLFGKDTAFHFPHQTFQKKMLPKDTYLSHTHEKHIDSGYKNQMNQNNRAEGLTFPSLTHSQRSGECRWGQSSG